MIARIFCLFFLIFSNINSFSETFSQELAGMVGTERFVLKVGETLLQRSADVSLRADGVPSGENPEDILKAAKHVHEKLDEVDLSKTTVVNMLGGTALTLMGQLERTPRLLKDVKDVLKSQGKSTEEVEAVQSEVKELFNDDEFLEIYTEFDQDLQKIAQEKKVLAEKKKALREETPKDIDDLTPPSLLIMLLIIKNNYLYTNTRLGVLLRLLFMLRLP